MQIFNPESLLDKCRFAVFPNDVLKQPKLRENLSPLLPFSLMNDSLRTDVMANSNGRVSIPIR